MASSPTTASRAAWFALWVLVSVIVLRWVDQVVLTVGTEPMRKALGLSDTQLGLLHGLGLTLAAAIGSVPLAWLADRYDRRWVLAACIVFWSAATAARGFAHSFELVMISTIGMSLAEASVVPIAYAIIPSLFQGRQRATANFIFYAGSALGFSVAMLLVGRLFAAIDSHAASMPGLLSSLEPWRTATIAVALIGPLVAALVLAMRDGQPTAPPRALVGSDNGELKDYLWAHWRAVVGVFGAAALSAAALAPLMGWLPVAMARRFGLTPAEVGAQTGMLYLVATVAGIALSAVFARLWGDRLGDLLPLRTGPLLTALSTLPLGFIALAESLTALKAAIFLVLVLLIAFNASMPLVYQGIAPARLRARLIAIGAACGIVVSALTPIAVGVVSDRVSAGGSGLLVICAAMGVPLVMSSAAVMRWSVRPASRAFEAVRSEDAS
jgi:MFS family permease